MCGKYMPFGWNQIEKRSLDGIHFATECCLPWVATVSHCATLTRAIPYKVHILLPLDICDKVATNQLAFEEEKFKK